MTRSPLTPTAYIPEGPVQLDAPVVQAASPPAAPPQPTEAFAAKPAEKSGGGLQQSSLASMTLDATVDFTWENLNYDVQVLGDDGLPATKTLLHSVSGTARGGRVLAVMGPSGAGKTTLMSGIIGRLQNDESHALTGCVFLNDTVFTERYKKLVSFVAQDDIVLGKETPAEAFYFSSRVRLGLTHEEALARAEDTLTRLHLQKCRDTYLGVPGLVKGVSGGEKKRTNIGNELITNPYVILLDEPTTGLDSVNALRVGQLLQDLARDDKRTVLCTIHSPSSELFAVFDDLLLLAKGHVIYHGPTVDAAAYFASVGYPVPPRTNPSEYYMNLLQLQPTELEQLWKSWEAYLLSPAADANLSVAPMSAEVRTHDAQLDKRVSEKGSDFQTQLHMLTARSWRQVVRDPGATSGRTIQTLFFAILLGLFFFGVDKTREGVQDRTGAMFMIMMGTMMMSSTAGVMSFPPERAVFLLEQSSENYNPWTYSLAKTVADLPFQIIFPIVFTCVTYFMIDFVNTVEAFFKMLLVIVLIGNVSYSFGMMVISLFPSLEIAMAAVPLVFLPLSIVAGLFTNTDRLDPAWLWLTYISFPRYSYMGLFLGEFGALDTFCGANDTSCSYKTGQDVINYYGFTDISWGTCVYALVIFIVGFKLLGAFSLWLQGRNKRGNLNFRKNLDAREMSPRAAAIGAAAQN